MTEPRTTSEPDRALVETRTAALSGAIGAYDIRGRIPDQLDDDIVFALGWASARAMSTLHGATEVVVGHDMRPSSPAFAAAFAAGVRSAGMRATLIGLCSTDQLYFASGLFDLPGAMITASHNPADYNGIKICSPGAGGVSRTSGLDLIEELVALAPASSGEAVVEDTEAAATMRRAYAERIRALTGIADVEGLRIVADAGNGMAGKLLGEVFGSDAGLPVVDFEVIGLYTELDGTFPNHEANPLKPENLVDVRAAVLEHGADLGLAFDGDADRCFFISEAGQALSASAVGALVATREIARARAAGRDRPVVIHNLITSTSVPEAILAAGGRPLRSRVGHSGIKQLMREQHAVFACEHSAHFYFEEFFGADSGMLAACHLITALAHSRTGGAGRADAETSAAGTPQPARASALVAAYDTYAQSGEINFSVTDPDAVLAAFAESAHDFGDGRIDDLDGISLVGEDWWINLRRSNTEPLVRLNIEAREAERVAQLTSRVSDFVSARA